MFYFWALWTKIQQKFCPQTKDALQYDHLYETKPKTFHRTRYFQHADFCCDRTERDCYYQEKCTIDKSTCPHQLRAHIPDGNTLCAHYANSHLTLATPRYAFFSPWVSGNGLLENLLLPLKSYSPIFQATNAKYVCCQQLNSYCKKQNSSLVTFSTHNCL